MRKRQKIRQCSVSDRLYDTLVFLILSAQLKGYKTPEYRLYFITLASKLSTNFNVIKSMKEIKLFVKLEISKVVLSNTSALAHCLNIFFSITKNWEMNLKHS